MRPVEPTLRQLRDALEEWGDLGHTYTLTIGGPQEGPDVIPCPAIAHVINDGDPLIHVAWELDEIELARLAQGGTLWLTCWGGLPIHRLEVVEAAQ